MRVTAPGSPLPLGQIDRRLRLVVFECPYDTIELPGAPALFGKLVRFKIAGYKTEYPYGATPVDTGDIIGTHLLLCEEAADGELEPLMGFKSVSLSRCKLHDVEFPAYHLFPESGAEPYVRALERILQSAQTAGEEVAYNGSWTVRSDLRADRAFVQLCYDLTVLLLVRYYTDYGIRHVLGAATVRFKVHRFKEFMGWRYLEGEGGRLPTFPCKPFFDEEVALMHVQDFSAEAKALAGRYRDLWEARLVLRILDEQDQGRKAA